MSDTAWRDALFARYGDAVPAADRILVRAEMEPFIEQMLAALHERGFLHDIEFTGFEERAPGWLISHFRYRHDGLSKRRKRLIEDAIADWSFYLPAMKETDE
ncbi:hypothetical protein ACQZ48_18205 [Agrobacterium sp. 22-209-1]